MERTKRTIVLILLVLGLLTPIAGAKSIGIQLREALYQEQVSGDIDAAIEIYKKVIETAAQSRRYAAKAHYRLGLCYIKKGQNQKAITHFETIIKDYPDQGPTVSKAKKELKKIKPAQSSAPTVISSTPAVYSNDVSTDVDKLTVTFNQPMIKGNFSWVKWNYTFPETTGKPYYDSEGTTCTLPVKLGEGTAYLLRINAKQYSSFMNTKGVKAQPFVLVFATKDKDGKPTPIPDEMLKFAKYINGSNSASSAPQKTTWQQKKYQLHDNTALDLDSGAAITLNKEWPDEYDIAWDNDAGGVLMIKPKSSARIIALPGITDANFNESFESANQTRSLLQKSPSRGFPAIQSKFAAVLTDKGNVAIINIADFEPKNANIYVWMEEKKSNLTPATSPAYTQKSVNDIQPDGTIKGKSTVIQINNSSQAKNSYGFINSDFVHITKIYDEKNIELKFTEKHEKDIFSYNVQLNEPWKPGGLQRHTHESLIYGLITPVEGLDNVFQYYMRHWPGTSVSTKRIETYLLPEGAEIISMIPPNMKQKTVRGRIMLIHEETVKTGTSITTSFQYRLTGTKIEYKDISEAQVEKIVRNAVQIISTCAEGDPKVNNALKTLKPIKPKLVLKNINKHLDSKSPTKRRSAIYIAWRGDFKDITPVQQKLIELCSHEENITRGMAALALGEGQAASSFDILNDMTLNDKDGYARRCGAYALGLMGNEKALPTLEKALKDSDPLVKANAEAAITMLKDLKEK